ncbi:Receptor-like serine/threonine-protein kinase [Citrus sinensis]|uniref:Bulb-type lectin domain-containing protein n=1 Tax=Citrus clementina TaxID=85681 RepID=V4W3G2_CITCL|nr:hypothetical protein CICLE_v10017473mg [Citrus x clementina]KAH9743980.1 Receptor-like serine/threonine-protein kinase [Citrus sinensis]
MAIIIKKSWFPKCFLLSLFLFFQSICLEGLIHISSPQFLPGNQILTTSEGKPVIWVANREKPVFNSAYSAFELLEEDAVLLNQSGAATWSTNSTSKVQNSATGKLLDCGYLVVTNTLELSNWNGPLFTMKMIFTSVPEIPLNRYVKNITFVYNENESNCTYASTLPNAFTRKGKFLVMSSRRFPKNSQSLAATTDEECELACLSNCACNASAFDNRAMAKRKTTLIVATVISRFFALLAIVLVIRRRRRSAGLFETVVDSLVPLNLKQAEKQFYTEVKTIGMILLINLVHLMGTCVEASKRFLVYENMPNGSLESVLFRKSEKFLAWQSRYEIAIGTARGLAYLHEDLAKLNGRDFSRVLTTMRGTRGYLAPERISGEAVTPKADVLCYGMLLLEVISGRRRLSRLFSSSGRYTVYQGENAIALSQIQDNKKDWPTMVQVVKVLEGVSEAGIAPIQRFLRHLAEDPAKEIAHQETSSASDHLQI